jgi:hypothetical protein
MVAMDDLAELFVPLFGIFFLFGAPIIAFVIFRVLAHRERMEMIRHGLDPGPRSSKDWQRAQAAPRGYAPDAYPGAFAKHSPQAALRKGASTAAVGFALLIGLSFIGYHDGPLGSTIHPGPWLLGGLIPFFVGLAQVFIAVMSGALGNVGGAQRVYGQPAPAPGAAPQPPPVEGSATPGEYSGSYTYRPGATQELRPPTPPPAQRDR